MGTASLFGLEPLVREMNLLKASGMEHGIGKSWYWRPMKKVPAGCSLEWANAGTIESVRSLRINYTGASQGGIARWFQRAVLCGNSGNLKLSGNYRVDRGGNAGRIVLKFAIYKNGGRKLTEQDVTAVVISDCKSGKWYSFSKEMKIPAGAKSIFVALEAFPGADIYFDNIKLIQQNIDSVTVNRKLKDSLSLVVPKAGKKIIVDGKIEDWLGVEFTSLKSAETYNSAMNIVENGTSKAELKNFKGRFACQWTPELYYICAEITDRKFPFENSKRKEVYWVCDSIQVAFSPGPERTIKRFAPRDNSMVFLPKTAKSPQSLIFETKAPAPGIARKVQFIFSKTRNGYIFEAAIPAELVSGETVIMPQSAVGFNLVINNNDGGGRKWLEWAGGLSQPKWRWLNSTRDPSKFGIAIMAKSRNDYLTGYFLKPEGIISDEKPATLDFVIVAAKDTGPVKVNAFAKTEDGKKYPFTITMPVKAGVNSKQISLDVTALGAGKFDLEAACRAGDNSFRTTCTITVVPIAGNIKKVKELTGILRGNIAKLKSLVDKCKAKGEDTSVPAGSIAVATVFIDFANYDVFHPNYSKKAVRYLDFCNDLMKKRIAQAENVLAGKEKYPGIPKWSMKNITGRDGRLWSGKTPVFLNGYCAGRRIDYPEIFAELGVNVIGFALDPSDGMVSVEKTESNYYKNKIVPFLQICEKYNFTSFWLLNQTMKGQMKKNILKQYPDITNGSGNFCDYDIDHPAYRELWRNFLKETMPRIANNPYIFAFDLQNEAGWKHGSGKTVNKFRKWLNEKYGSNFAQMKKNWGKDAPPSIARTVGYPQNGDNSPGRYYDWCDFNSDRVGEHLSFLKNEIAKYFPDRGFSIKIAGEKPFTGSVDMDGKRNDRTHLNEGLDREKIAKILNIQGCDVRPVAASKWGSREYAFAWFGSALTYDFMKSIAPDQPIMDNEWHSVDTVFYRNRNIDPAHIKVALWHARLHGLSACVLWFWGRGSKVVRNPIFFEGSILEQPWLVEAYTQTNLTQKRFVKEISAFAQASRPLSILYSGASATHDTGFLDALHSAFEGMNFLGLPLRFLTEEQLSKGEIKDIKLLVVPNAGYISDKAFASLDALSQKGIKIMVAGEKSFKYDQWGQSRKNQPYTFERISAKSAEDYFNAAENWLKKSSLKREMTVLDKTGKPAWGVESRTVEVEGKRFAYILNLRPETAEITLQFNCRNAAPVDLLSHRKLTQQVTMPSRDVIFFQY